MRYILITIIVGFFIGSIFFAIMSDPVEITHNKYGGSNDSGWVGDYYVVGVYDKNGSLLCSYPISDTYEYKTQLINKFSCSEDQMGKVFKYDY